MAFQKSCGFQSSQSDFLLASALIRANYFMSAMSNSTLISSFTFTVPVVAAAFIALTKSGWPDIMTGAVIATVNLLGAIEVVSAAIGEMGKTDSD